MIYINMEKKLLLFDLDDTLLTAEKTITANTVEAIKDCKARGMFIGYITGRARPWTGEVFFSDKYNLPNDFTAYYNGAEIYTGDLLKESNLISYESAMQIIRSLIKIYPDAKIGVKHEPWSYLKRSGCSEGENWNRQTGEKIKCAVLELPHYDVQRIIVEFEKDDDKNKLRELMTEDAIFFVNVDGSAMILNKNATKERALKKASEYLNIPYSDIISFGDDINDTGMLKTAGIGIAVANAVDEAKAAADFICGSNDDDGVAKWIEANIF